MARWSPMQRTSSVLINCDQYLLHRSSEPARERVCACVCDEKRKPRTPETSRTRLINDGCRAVRLTLYIYTSTWTWKTESSSRLYKKKCTSQSKHSCHLKEIKEKEIQEILDVENWLPNFFFTSLEYSVPLNWQSGHFLFSIVLWFSGGGGVSRAVNYLTNRSMVSHLNSVRWVAKKKKEKNRWIRRQSTSLLLAKVLANNRCEKKNQM